MSDALHDGAGRRSRCDEAPRGMTVSVLDATTAPTANRVTTEGLAP